VLLRRAAILGEIKWQIMHGNFLVAESTKFTRRARLTWISKPSLPPARGE